MTANSFDWALGGHAGAEIGNGLVQFLARATLGKMRDVADLFRRRVRVSRATFSGRFSADHQWPVLGDHRGNFYRAARASGLGFTRSSRERWHRDEPPRDLRRPDYASPATSA